MRNSQNRLRMTTARLWPDRRNSGEVIEPAPSDAEKVLRVEDERSSDPAGTEEKPMVVAD